MSVFAVLRGFVKYRGLQLKLLQRELFVMRSVKFHDSKVLHRQDGTDLNDEPIKFSESRATEQASFTARRTHPAHRSNSLLISMTVFMFYFFVLREENDVDERLGAIFNLEELDVIRAIEYGKAAGNDTTELETVLAKIRSERTTAK